MNKHKPWLAHYDPAVPPHIRYPNKSIIDLFNDTVAVFPDTACTILADRVFTYSEISTFSNRIATHLIKSGLNKGDPVGIVLPNIPEFVMAYYGILKAGGIVLALNPGAHLDEIVCQINEVGIRHIILAESVYQGLIAHKEAIALSHFIVHGMENSYTDSSLVFLSDIIADESLIVKKLPEVKPDDVAIYQFSGGTTGTPKCAIGSHHNLVANTIQFRKWLVNAEDGQEKILIAIPLYHVYGMVLGLNLAVLLGAGMILIPNPREMDHLLSQIERYKASIFPGVPSLYNAINHFPPVQGGWYDLSSIKACISGSETLPLQVKQAFENLTGGHLVEGYGLSEAPTATHCNPILGENRDGSIGLPLPDVACRIVDIETGLTEMPVGETGELIIRGPQVMPGYLNRPEETANALRDGWLYTGDICKMDEDGYFYLVDRKKDVIKVGGFQVWPNEVEKIILTHPAVKEVAVAGVLQKEEGERVVAWVVVREDQTLTAKDVIDWCQMHLTRYKVPSHVMFMEALPRTGVGKILRRKLVSNYPEE